MQELKQLFTLEQPRINAVLQRHVAELPLSARPVAEHVLKAGGKRLRPLLTLLTGRALGAGEEAEPDLYVLGSAIEMLHAATLLHDDILDNAGLRRGKPAAHTVFAPSTVILAGDALLAKALLMVSRLGNSRLTDTIAEAVMRTAEGEIAEFDNLNNPALSQENYLEIITGKTAWMLRASCELGALRAGASPELVRNAGQVGLELGIAFQMVDDALDYAPAEQTGKPMGGDLREGKMTPPLLLFLADCEPSAALDLKQSLASGTVPQENLNAVCAAVHDGGYAAKARRMAEDHLAQASEHLARFPESGERLVLEQMLQYILRRDH